jgi:hypothetical protein
MASKIYDLAVKTGEYTNRNGETKGRYIPVGVVMKGDDGNPYILMNKTFNPAGVPDRADGKTSDVILVSMYKPQAQDSAQSAPTATATPTPAVQKYVNEEPPF